MIGEFTGSVERGNHRSILVKVAGHEYEIPVDSSFDERYDVGPEGIIELRVEVRPADA